MPPQGIESDIDDRAGAFDEERRVKVRLTRLGEPAEAGGVDLGNAIWSSLSPAQQEVVALIVSGMTNRQVAEKLRLSPHTVNAHLRFAFAKLSVHSRVELAGLYYRMQAQSSQTMSSAPRRAVRR